MQSERTGLPLAGIRVVDFGLLMAGPYGGRLLAELGAEVIKVEPLDGEQNRYQPPLRDGHSTYFGQMNAGKRSVALDLRSEDGIEAARRIILGSDVVLENFRPGVMARKGLDYASLADAAPRLIYCSVSGYGQTGPRAHLPSNAPIINADSGFDLANLSYQDDGGDVPAATGLYIADIVGGIAAYAAITTALFQRERTGRGQHLDVSLFDMMVSIPVMDLQAAQHGYTEPGNTFRPARTRDGFVLVTTISQRNFIGTMQVIGREELIDDERFSISGRATNRRELHEIIESWTSQRTTDEAIEAFRAGGVPCTRYRTIAEVLADPGNPPSTFRDVVDGAGTYKVAGLPFTLSAAVGQTEEVLPVPALGDRTHEVLTTVAGYSEAEVDRLISEGIARADKA